VRAQVPPTEEVAAALGVGQPKRRRGWWIGGGVVVLIGIVGSFLALRGGEDEVSWQTAEVAVDDLDIRVTAIGTLEPLHAVDVSSETSGTVARVHADTNDRVTAGQVLAELDTALLDAELRRTRAAWRSAEASLVQARVSADAAQTELQRTRQLHGSAVVSQSALDQAQTTYDQAVAAVAVAEAATEQARAVHASTQLQRSRATILSPIDGVVLARDVEPGQAVVSSLQAARLFQVAEGLERMSVDVEIDEADIGQVHEGQTADFTVAAWPDRVFDAVVHKVELAPRLTTGVVTYIACLHLDNPDGLLRPGMTATARIQTRTWEQALLLPDAALRFAPPEAAALPPPATSDGRQVQRVWRLGLLDPEPVEVVVGASDGVRSVVLEGELSAGDDLLIGMDEPRGR
jgi:HlyD family secretion protein